MVDDKKERRENPRVQTEIKAFFRDAKEFDNNFIGNISKGGLLVKSERPLAQNTQFTLRFNISGINREFECLCKVMWVQELFDPSKDKMIPTMGVKFLELSKEDLKLIEEFISKKLENEPSTN